VEFADSVRLTRLPVGRAEGRIWLAFVAVGLGFNQDPDIAYETRWKLRDHLKVTGESGALVIEGSSESSDGKLTYLEHELTDDGSSHITIEYREGDQALGEEVIELPEED
jgi:hypothetical protein